MSKIKLLKDVFKKINKDKSIINNCINTQKYVYNNYFFGYNTKTEIMNDFKDEFNELWNEISKEDITKIEMEIGDLLFVLCNISNKYNINLDDALKKSTVEYQKRLEYIENKVGSMNLNRDRIIDLWNEAKNRNN